MADKNKKNKKKDKAASTGLLSRDIGSLKGRTRGKLPTKTTINLVPKDEDRIKPQVAIPAVILICLLAALFGKIFVADRLIASSRASGRASAAQRELEDVYGKIAGYEEVEDVYAHYTLSGMTAEELSRVERTQVMRIAQEALAGGYKLNSWSVTENVLTLKVTGDTLKELGTLSRVLELDPAVDSCVMSTADKGGKKKTEEEKDVQATFTVYLKQPSDETEG